MDDDYAAGGIKCPTGKISRKGYDRKTRRGKKIHVSAKCVKDVGAPGRWQTIKHMLGISKLKEGSLKAVGYDAQEPAPKRHEAIKKAVDRYGKLSTLRKLNAVALYTKRTAPSRSKTYRTDKKWVKKTYF
jgi:hypothetical protein